jgi:hypothetical protein
MSKLVFCITMMATIRDFTVILESVPNHMVIKYYFRNIIVYMPVFHHYSKFR